MAGSRELRNLAIDGTPALRGGAVPRRVAGASYRWTGGARYENAGTAQDLAWAAEAAQASTRATAQDEVSDVDMANADGEAQTDSDDMSEIIYVAGANVPGSPDHGASDHGDEDDDEAPKCNDFAYIQAGTEHGEPRRCEGIYHGRHDLDIQLHCRPRHCLRQRFEGDPRRSRQRSQCIPLQHLRCRREHARPRRRMPLSDDAALRAMPAEHALRSRFARAGRRSEPLSVL